MRSVLGKRLILRVTTLAPIDELLQGIFPHAKEIAGQPSDQLPGPGAPDAPVCAPKEPRPHPRSGAARAIPEEDH